VCLIERDANRERIERKSERDNDRERMEKHSETASMTVSTASSLGFGGGEHCNL